MELGLFPDPVHVSGARVSVYRFPAIDILFIFFDAIVPLRVSHGG